MLIAWGVVGALYILQSSSDSWLFSIGLFWEKVFGLATYVLILAFPTGRLDRLSKVLLGVGVFAVLLLAVAIQLVQPQVGAGGSISSCRSLCPRNELSFTSDPALALDLFEVFSYAVLALAVAVAAVVIHRFITGTPPRRRALAIGTPVALLFLLCEILYQLLTIVGADDSELYGIVIWVFVAARAGVWYGFLFALIAAQLFAARAMERLLEQSLNHPSKQELEVMLREPLGDPQLRLQFLPDGAGEPDAERRAVEAGPGRDVTVVQRDGKPAGRHRARRAAQRRSRAAQRGGRHRAARRRERRARRRMEGGDARPRTLADASRASRRRRAPQGRAQPPRRRPAAADRDHDPARAGRRGGHRRRRRAAPGSP